MRGHLLHRDRLTGCKLGYLRNFGEELMKSGITRCVNHLES